MLDKTIPYKDIIMKVTSDSLPQLPQRQLPQGYHFAMYEEGDEIGWANLETSVEEFRCYEDAQSYFQRVFMPYKAVLSKRMCFIKDEHNQIVSTASAWFKEDDKRRYALLHWVSTSPKHQGKGLARAIVCYALSKFKEVEPNEAEVFLHTQTWSYKAIVLYYKLGFRISRTPLMDCMSDMDCIPILESKIASDIMQDIVVDC